jgi:hypothetical protein
VDEFELPSAGPAGGAFVCPRAAKAANSKRNSIGGFIIRSAMLVQTVDAAGSTNNIQ